ncbi:MAG: Holliday junction resolvase [Candidatus Diapherotrites archaeon]|uniref:Holliday junction resolvase n=1 Tax=Candidatus Iainarchaeum sp. TaxID=3101447 RepID=A0A8T4L388_9ARCH|nr:Holliday junction resolvase [Candidatus Diapherotrites archaeon]
MSHYNKGSAAERELIGLFYDQGFAVVRAAGSGTNALTSPDLVVLRNGKAFAVEAKAWAKNNLSIDRIQFDDLLLWAKKAGCTALFAWKYPRQGWFFLLPEAFHETGRGFAISYKDAIAKKIDFNVLIGAQTVLNKP